VETGGKEEKGWSWMFEVIGWGGEEEQSKSGRFVEGE
jgi:hypothetical protein